MRGANFKKLFSVLIIALFLFSFAVFAADDTTTTDATTESTDIGTTENADTTNADTTVVEEPKGYSIKKSTDWLRKETESVEGLSPFQLSLVILALNNQGVDVDSDVAVLKDPANFDSETGCFQADNCHVTDSSLGLIALEKTSQDEYSKVKDYLLNVNAETAGLKEGEWRLQLDVAGNGTCIVAYGENNRSKKFDVDSGIIKGTSGKYFIDISKEIDASLIGSKISQPLSIDCSDLSGVASLVYYLRKGNSYFLLDSQPLSAGMADLRIVNACFRAKPSTGGCDLLSSLYGTWGLVEAGIPLNEIGTLPYLESTIIINSGNDLHNAILVRILQKSGNANVYFDNLLVSKQSGGSWGRGDVYTTSWALFALQKASGSYGDAVTAATSFLEKRNKEDGSWNENVQNTAMALIALYGPDLATGHVSGSGVVNSDVSTPSEDQITEICAGKMDDKYGRTGCSSLECKDSDNCLCKNGRKDSGEEDVDCGGSCDPCITEELQETGKTGEEVTTGEETQPTETTTSGTTPKSSSLLIWVIVIILIVAAGGGVIFYLKSQGKLGSLGNIFKKKPKGPSFDEFKKQLESRPVMPSQPSRPVQRPMPSRVTPARKVVDDELEKSLREAEKLLKGK